jgi:hypothetical protein
MVTNAWLRKAKNAWWGSRSDQWELEGKREVFMFALPGKA